MATPPKSILMESQTYASLKHYVAGWLLSIKLDGMKGFWIPSARGMPTCDIPWSSDKKDRISTGLFSRYGNEIAAPDWFLDILPPFAVVGELWLGPKQFQDLVSITKTETPDERWKDIRFKIFDSPKGFGDEIDQKFYFEVYPFLQNNIKESFNVQVINQKKLPLSSKEYKAVIDTEMERALAQGHEGLMLRDPLSLWEKKRSRNILKLKPVYDDEAVVTGTHPGEGKYTGMIGSLICVWKNKTFKVSGMEDHERAVDPKTYVGRTITFQYRELSKDGIPREARFDRFRETV
jgi:DNA ligase-1